MSRNSKASAEKPLPETGGVSAPVPDVDGADVPGSDAAPVADGAATAGEAKAKPAPRHGETSGAAPPRSFARQVRAPGLERLVAAVEDLVAEALVRADLQTTARPMLSGVLRLVEVTANRCDDVDLSLMVTELLQVLARFPK